MDDGEEIEPATSDDGGAGTRPVDVDEVEQGSPPDGAEVAGPGVEEPAAAEVAEVPADPLITGEASEPVGSEPSGPPDPEPVVTPPVDADAVPADEPIEPSEPVVAEPVATEPGGAEPAASSEPVVEVPAPVAAEPSAPTAEPMLDEPLVAPAAEAGVAPAAPEPAVAHDETPTPATVPSADPAPTEERAEAPVAAEAAAPSESVAPEAVAAAEDGAAAGEAGDGGDETADSSTDGPGDGKGAGSKGSKQPARILEGVVTSVSSEEAELTLDDGRTAVINRRNFAPGDLTPDQVLSVGDRAFGAELKRDDPKKRVVLSRAWALKKQAWDRVVEAAARNDTLTGTVTSAGAKGLVVDVGVRGFVPSSHLELEPVSDLQPYVGQSLELRVLEANPGRERLVLSRRNLLLKEQRRKAQEVLSTLQAGMVCTGTVTSLTNYGAFVDVGGVNGLVHLSELAWTRVRRPSDVVSVGDEVEVKVLDVKAKKRRVSLSIRQLSPDPLAGLEVGTVHEGPVTRLVDFGAFVALGEVEGLVHLSEMAEYRVSTPEEIVTPGEKVWVKILSVDTKRRRVELSIRRAAEYG